MTYEPPPHSSLQYAAVAAAAAAGNAWSAAAAAADRPPSSQGWAPEPPPPHDEDVSMSPPPPPPVALYQHLHPSPAKVHGVPSPSSLPLITVKPPHALSSSPGPHQQQQMDQSSSGGGGRRAPKKARKSSGSAGDGSDQNGEKKKGKKAKAPKDSGGPKRVYTCPHCQRSYDWNYNLNRHLKYECGKENAFQCSKCGRKFPHKQNCVYHLKRKHKIVCDTIDQYMTSGLVLFRGSAGPQGQQQASKLAAGAPPHDGRTPSPHAAGGGSGGHSPQPGIVVGGQ